MKSSFKLVAMVMVVGVLCVGVVALATDFAWDSAGAVTSWRSVTNWDLDSSYPQNITDNAAITGGGYTCTLNENGLLWVNRVTLAGSSPTRRKLHSKDGILLANELYLQDYAELDVDQNVTVLDHTYLSGNVWVDVASGASFSAQASGGHGHPGIHVETTSARLNLSGAGGFVADGIEVNADVANQALTLQFSGGTLTIGIYADIAIISDPGADNKRAKFWLDTGTITWNFGSYVEMLGGGSIARRAELDLDQNLELYALPYEPGYSMIDGYASIDIAANKKFTMPRMTIGELGNRTVVSLTVGTDAKIEVGL